MKTCQNCLHSIIDRVGYTRCTYSTVRHEYGPNLFTVRSFLDICGNWKWVGSRYYLWIGAVFLVLLFLISFLRG